MAWARGQPEHNCLGTRPTESIGEVGQLARHREGDALAEFAQNEASRRRTIQANQHGAYDPNTHAKYDSVAHGDKDPRG